MQNEIHKQTMGLRETIDKFIQENIVAATGAISSGPPANVYDTGTSLTVFIAIPGVRSENLDVTASGNTVLIRGTYNYNVPVDAKTLRQELPRGAFEKSVALPVSVETENATARYHDGILTLILPKTTKSPLRLISVETDEKPSPKTSPASGSAITKAAQNKSAATRQPQASPMIGKNADKVDVAADMSFPSSDPPSTIPGNV